MRIAASSPEGGRWFVPIAEHLRESYLRYSFTKGTAQEVGFLVDALELEAGQRVLDVGCGPGRHALDLAERGMRVTGVDISEAFVRLADGGGPGSFVVGDARALPVRPASFDAVISLCQGGFGLLGGVGEDRALAEMAAALRPGGRLAVSAFSAYFQVRWLEDHDTFDAATGVNHERTTVRNPDGEEAEVDLWTTCFTPRELRLLAERCELEVEVIWSVTPGSYDARPPALDHPELLVVARKPV